MSHSSSIVAGLTVAALLGAASEASVARVAIAASAMVDTTTIAPPDTTRSAPPSDSLRTITVKDSLGVPGTIKGQTVVPDPEEIKRTLQLMGSSEVAGATKWERQKNGKVAMLCSALLPGLGQTYNGRRLKVGVMVGFASYYMGNGFLSWKAYERSIVARDAAAPGSTQFRIQNTNADFYKEQARSYLWWSGLVWMLGIVDSWIDAHLYDMRQYTPPRPPDANVPRAVDERTSYMTIGFDLEFSK